MAYRTDENGDWVRTIRCSSCMEQGHNKLSCPHRKEQLANNIEELKEALTLYKEETWDHQWRSRQIARDEAELDKMVNRGKQRTCGYCHESGHNRATCAEKKSETKRVAEESIALRKFAAKQMETLGFGIGSLVQVGFKRDSEPQMAVVTGVRFNELYSPSHRYNGGMYFYPPQLIEYQLVRPYVDSWSDREITHGAAEIPVEFLNVEGHEISGSVGNGNTPTLVSDVVCAGLLKPEALDFDIVSKFVRDEFVDPKR